ncbi:hypothetical protein E2C01_057750 [Portunus trituberculatus]|uniref:Uncharacterized protein n=1 Tax=Portunus trituberculatus TaxID=210409 RepID=A0A5B7H177_PORTR|nr:hypothetical protein [Portunus trituberculatus]
MHGESGATDRIIRASLALETQPGDLRARSYYTPFLEASPKAQVNPPALQGDWFTQRLCHRLGTGTIALGSPHQRGGLPAK